MDGQRFDRITRSWARRSNRRGLLHLLGGGLLAGWSWGRGAASAAAQAGPDAVVCSQDADCADGDLDPCTGATCVDGTCAFYIVDCIPGYVCCGNGSCCPSGAPAVCLTDADCAPTSGDPCEGTSCAGGSCVSYFVTCAPDHVCCGNAICCPARASGCVTDGDCAATAGLSGRTRCVSGVCVP